MSFVSKWASGLAVGAALLAMPAEAQLWNKTIQTSYGPVVGFKYFNSSVLETYFNRSESSVTAFLGIPYAADTGYQNRWKPPQPHPGWNETFVADAFGANCPTVYYTTYSEDCLSLNIWTSANSSSDKLPVMVWNQGSEDGSNDPSFYGGGMALKDVIFVSFNRRDDAFGYLAHPELNAEGLALTGHNTSGNYGVLDHLEVLKWVQKNIANFGGDPEKVTIAGQSFGSSQTYHAVNSELFSGLFVGAIAESGVRYPYDTLLAGLAASYVTMDEAIFHGINYTNFHNVSTIEELRTLSTDEILKGSTDSINGTYIWWVTALSTGYPRVFKPVLDNYVLPMKYIDSLIQGPANDVPFITGNAKDESGAVYPSPGYTLQEYFNYTTIKYGNLSARYQKLYPGGCNATQANLAWNAAARDLSLAGTWAYARDWRKSAKSDIYTYLWTHAPPGAGMGAYHTSEIMYAMNALYANPTFPFVAEDFAIADAMSEYWANFAKAGDPNGEGLAEWRPTGAEVQEVMQLGDGFGMQTIGKEEDVQFMLDYFSQQVPY